MFFSKVCLCFCVIFISFFPFTGRADDPQQSLQQYVSQQVAANSLFIKPTDFLKNPSKNILLYDLGGCQQDPMFNNPIATSFRAQCTVEAIRAFDASSLPAFQKHRPQIIKEAELIISLMLQKTIHPTHHQNDLNVFLNEQQNKLIQMYQQKMDMIAHEEGLSQAVPASLLHMPFGTIEVYAQGAPMIEYAVTFITIPTGGTIKYLPQILADFNEFVLKRNPQTSPPYPPITMIQSDQVSLLGGKYWFSVSWSEGSKTIKNSEIHSNQTIEFRKD